MLEYVNLDYRNHMSIVAVHGAPGEGKIIGEARYDKKQEQNEAEVSLIIAEKYQNLGLATTLYRLLVKLAKDRGIIGFTCQVPASNQKIMNVFEKGSKSIKAELKDGTFFVVIPFDR